MNNKKKVFVAALAVCLVAILSFSTLAWFNDSDSVTNNFYVGGDGTDADKIFNLDVYEQVDEDKDGVADATIDYDGDSSADGSRDGEYENVVSGDLLWKKVYAQNKGSYDQWVRFKVTFDNASDWVALEQKYDGFKLYNMLMENKTTKLVDSAKWIFAADEIVLDDAADTVTYVFYYNDVLSAENNKWVYLFHYVQIPTQFDQHDMVLFADGKFSMTITGEAVQVDNVGAANAQEAFEIVNGQ